MLRTVITHSALGEISLLKGPRTRRISISVKPDGSVRVSMPNNIALAHALRFLDSKIEWVVSTRAKMETRFPTDPISMPYSTRCHTLLLDPAPVATIRTKIESGKIVVRYPQDKQCQDADVQAAIKKGIEQAWREESKAILPGRLKRFAEICGLQFRSVTIRNTVSKWGSCSSRDDISLSLHLMRLPDHLVDYILLHELCHTVHKNHGPQFHAMLDRHTHGMNKELRRELRLHQARW